MPEATGARTPSKPVPTSASYEELRDHYNSLVDPYNEAIFKMEQSGTKLPKSGIPHMRPVPPLNDHNMPPELVEAERHGLIAAIRKQNRRLGLTVRRRALELLEERIKGPDGRPMTDVDGRSIGLKYDEVLAIIRREFPEASTSVACLRWYVVHLRMDANDEGRPWPDLPQIRPRAVKKRPQQ